MIRATLSAFALLLLASALRADEPKLAGPLQPFVDAHSLAGAVVLVADRDKTLGLEAVGFSDVAGKQPMRPDSYFWIASMTKPITAAGLMALVDDGKVKLDDPIEKYLPEFKDLWQQVEADKDRLVLGRPKRPVTLRNCLSHMSGMPFKSALEQPTLDMLPLRDAVRSYAMTPLVSEPDSKYLYSNCGINTAGRVIEVVSGMPYEDFMRKRLFEPLGMSETTFRPTEAQLKRLARTYKPDAAKTALEETVTPFLKTPYSDPARQPMPGGGLFSTAEDVARFGRMALNGGMFDGKRILSAEAVKEMTRRQTPESVKESYGLGWTVGQDNFGHGGALATNLTVDTKRGLVLVYMVQHSGFANDGAKALGVFHQAARERYGKSAE